MTNRYILTQITAATLTDPAAGYGLIRDAAIAIDGGVLSWIGPRADLPQDYANWPQHDAGGALATPALIDCHTHIVHGGHRAREFEMRLEGASYVDIARAGGGINATVTATRTATHDDLLRDALKRVDTLMAGGVATIEVKSGYGLDPDTEIKMLQVARQIPHHRPVTVVTSFLGAHAVPNGQQADAYIDTVCIPTLRRAHAQGLVDMVDGFCENIAFSTQQMARVFAVAADLNLPIKLHAEQLTHQGGTALAAQFGALSVDHLEYATDADAQAMARAGSVAVMLPGAYYTLRDPQLPPIDAFRAHGVPMAVATDWNPGSSPMGSVLLAMNMACTLFRMTPCEALAGTTRVAAQALGLTDRGSLMAGKRADIALWDVTDPAQLSYGIGTNPLKQLILKGTL